jgi:hypothetical protein
MNWAVLIVTAAAILAVGFLAGGAAAFLVMRHRRG